MKYKLQNINPIRQNAEGIDLIDETNKIIAQVSSTCTKQKVENSLDKELLRYYPDYCFKFIAISGEADKLRTLSFRNPYKCIFNPATDIYDIKALLNLILNMPSKEQSLLYEFIKTELGENIGLVKIDSNLATIINILSKEDFSVITNTQELNSFLIDKKIEFNNLMNIRFAIDEYKIYYSRLNEKYNEFDRQGVNKSLSVFSVLRNQYVRHMRNSSDPHELFFAIIDNVIEIITESNNYTEIPYEELEMCVSILVVDSFIRCKIFDNPEGYSHVAT